MKVPSRLSVGVSTHTGMVRATNEDDYLLVAPGGAAHPMFVAAIADGLGGAIGGAEASRTALRAFAVAAIDEDGLSLSERVQRGFAAATHAVEEQSKLIPNLAGMATTLLALVFDARRVAFGHVGDSRAYVSRTGALRRLTQDHADEADRNRLLRCIGGGARDQSPDAGELVLSPGDRLVLCTDGVWGGLTEAAFLEAIQPRDAGRAAQRLVDAALQRGGHDNCTALVIDWRADDEGGGHEDVELPRDEISTQEDLPRAGRLGTPRWPLAALAAAGALAAASWARWALDFDVFAWIRSAF